MLTVNCIGMHCAFSSAYAEVLPSISVLLEMVELKIFFIYIFRLQSWHYQLFK